MIVREIWVWWAYIFTSACVFFCANLLSPSSLEPSIQLWMFTFIDVCVIFGFCVAIYFSQLANSSWFLLVFTEKWRNRFEGLMNKCKLKFTSFFFVFGKYTRFFAICLMFDDARKYIVRWKILSVRRRAREREKTLWLRGSLRKTIIIIVNTNNL